MKNQTAVEWLVTYTELNYYSDNDTLLAIEQAKEMEKQKMIDLVQSLIDYTYESHNILGHDNRSAEEFVDIFLNNKKQ